MILDRQEHTDVLVLGSGIAGLMAAIHAARSGARVTLSSSVNLYSGSTFFPGTWGFGLIGPEDEKDEEDLMETILQVGKGVALPPLVRTFVENLNSSIDQLEELGITLEAPSEEAKGQKEYIPCFDHKHRRWRGITKKNLLEAMPRLLREYGITECPNFEAVEIVKEKGRVTGVIGIKDRKSLLFLGAKAVILATGGLGGLYKYRLTTDDVNGSGVGMALRAGAKAVNMEFMQIMLGFVTPGFKTVHNEKTFFASRFHTKTGEDLLRARLPEGMNGEDVLSARSLHGPFSSEGLSRYLDLAIHEEMTETGSSGVKMTYDLERLSTQGEFVRTYFDWLKKEKKVDISDEITVAPFMHASNGGILINEEGKTSIPGLFAAGECTGGMHGADRIGGLSTANGIVFGKISGEHAAEYARSLADQTETKDKEKTLDFTPVKLEEAKEKMKKLQEVLYAEAFLKRNEASITKAKKHLEALGLSEDMNGPLEDIRSSYSLYNGLAAAKVLLTLQDLRSESRGSFYRSDHEERNDNAYGRAFIVSYEEESLLQKDPRHWKVTVTTEEKEDDVKW